MNNQSRGRIHNYFQAVTGIRLLLFVLAVLIVVLLQYTDAVARLVIDGDDQLIGLYVDGANYTDKLPNGGNVFKCDWVELPPNAGVISVEAKNGKQPHGIQACNTAKTALYKDWVCRPARKMQGNDWYQPKYNDKSWKPAKYYPCEKHCRPYFKQPCQISATQCFWSHKDKPVVRCRLKRKLQNKLVRESNSKGCSLFKPHTRLNHWKPAVSSGKENLSLHSS